MVRIILLSFFSFFLFLLSGCTFPPPAHSIPISDISGVNNYSYHVKRLVHYALYLSKKKLRYRFGSNNPRHGGMDCSGTIQYLLWQTAHIHAPRDARDMYLWIERQGVIHHVHAYSFRSSQFNRLHAGDLLFWTGTYYTRRKPPITHVMMYLGKDKHGHPLMFGATEGTYHGRLARGVGVFDFTLPYPGERAHFVAYGCIPHYTCRYHA